MLTKNIICPLHKGTGSARPVTTDIKFKPRLSAMWKRCLNLLALVHIEWSCLLICRINIVVLIKTVATYTYLAHHPFLWGVTTSQNKMTRSNFLLSMTGSHFHLGESLEARGKHMVIQDIQQALLSSKQCQTAALLINCCWSYSLRVLVKAWCRGATSCYAPARAQRCWINQLDAVYNNLMNRDDHVLRDQEEMKCTGIGSCDHVGKHKIEYDVHWKEEFPWYAYSCVLWRSGVAGLLCSVCQQNGTKQCNCAGTWTEIHVLTWGKTCYSGTRPKKYNWMPKLLRQID